MKEWMNRKRKQVLRSTKSLCPDCMAVLEACIVEREGQVYMEKVCAQHGAYSTLIWQDTGENYLRWLEYGGAGEEALLGSCPHSCGLCKDHRSNSVSAALMVTTECDLACPICFTRGGEPAVPTLEELRRRLEAFKAEAGDTALIELCGGEPTTRDDLPEVVAMVSGIGFPYIQLNTNGLRIGREPDYLKNLADAGLTTVYMGLDGVRPEPYATKSGRDIFQNKIAALESCRAAGVTAVLVPCVIPGENDDQLGEIIAFAKNWMPTVKGVHFQPVSYFGAYPKAPDDSMRITIPEILRRLEAQTEGEIPAAAFLPGHYEHAACSFQGYFGKSGGRLHAYTGFTPRERSCDVESLRRNSMNLWKASPMEFLSIGGMAFQDVWNIDLQRLCRCTIHIIGENGTRSPLCAKYVTSCHGKRLYPNIS